MIVHRVNTNHVMKSIHVHVTASYATSKLMEGCSRSHELQSYIPRLVYAHESLMALNRKLAWEMLRAFCLLEMSCLVEVTRLMNLKILPRLMEILHVEKSISTKKFSKYIKYGVVPCVSTSLKMKL